MKQCEWCGIETQEPLKKNFTNDDCCVDCIDDANIETRFIKNCDDIERLKDYELKDIVLSLIVRSDISLDYLNEIYFENKTKG
jgi:hypothetical protein